MLLTAKLPQNGNSQVLETRSIYRGRFTNATHKFGERISTPISTKLAKGQRKAHIGMVRIFAKPGLNAAKNPQMDKSIADHISTRKYCEVNITQSWPEIL